jgi:flagellar basal body rod protein FlgG
LKTFEIAAQAMQADMQRLTTISQNIANAQTPAYKRVVSVQRPFSSEMDVAAAALSIDPSAGPLRATSNPLDLAIEGDGFFVFQGLDGLAMSRRASLKLDPQGRLVNELGLPIQTDRGEVRVPLPASGLHIDNHGEIWLGERSLGRLQMVTVGNPSELRPLGDGLYGTAAANAMQPAELASIQSGRMEASNVNTSAEMVRLMETTRHFEAMARLVQGYDDTMDKALRKLGDLGS